MEPDEDEVDVCAYCGAPVPEKGWIALEVQRPGVAEAPVPDYVNSDFCSQDHAARWLAQPLPAPAPWEPYVPTGKDRLADAGLFAAIVGGFGFAGLGVGVTIWWLLTLIW